MWTASGLPPQAVAQCDSLPWPCRSQNQTLKKWGADRLLRGSQREQWHKMKESYDKLMEGSPSARVIREHLAMAAPESMRPQAACDKCGCAMIRVSHCWLVVSTALPEVVRSPLPVSSAAAP